MTRLAAAVMAIAASVVGTATTTPELQDNAAGDSNEKKAQPSAPARNDSRIRLHLAGLGDICYNGEYAMLAGLTPRQFGEYLERSGRARRNRIARKTRRA